MVALSMAASLHWLWLLLPQPHAQTRPAMLPPHSEQGWPSHQHYHQDCGSQVVAQQCFLVPPLFLANKLLYVELLFLLFSAFPKKGFFLFGLAVGFEEMPFGSVFEEKL